MAELALVGAVVTVLILVNAFYVAAEFGAVSARRSRIHEMAQRRNWLASLLLPVVQDAAALDRYVATCQIGITLSSLVLGAYGQATLAVLLIPLAARWGGLQPLAAESAAALAVLVSLTALQVVFGELIPKSLALRHPTGFALYTVLPMRWSQGIFRWFIAVLNGSGVLVLRAIGMAQHGHRHVHSPEELELLIAESRDGGLLAPDEQRRLHQALRLGLRRARHLMVPRGNIVGIDVRWSPERVLQVVLDTPFSRLPVYDGSLDQVVGILHTRDLVMARVQRPATTLRELTRAALIVPEMMPANEVLRRLRERRTHLAIVIDEFGSVEGLLSLEDVLSELLGDVGDEFHPEAAGVERMPDGRLRVPGQLRLEDAPPWLVTGGTTDADTVAGYVMQVLGHVPVEGERIAVGDIVIEVERMRGHAPRTLLVSRPAGTSRAGRKAPPLQRGGEDRRG